MKPLAQLKTEMRTSVYAAIDGTAGIDPDERARRRMLIDELLDAHPDPKDALNQYMNAVGDEDSLNGQLTEVMQRGIKYAGKVLRRALDETMGRNEAYCAFSYAAGQARRIIEDAVDGDGNGPSDNMRGLVIAIGEGMNTLGMATLDELDDEDAMKATLSRAIEVAKARAVEAAKAHPHPEGEYCPDCEREHVKVPPGGILLIGLEPSSIALLAQGRVVRLPDSGKFLRQPIMLAQSTDLGPEGIATIMDTMKPKDVVSVPWATGLLVSKADIGRRDVLDFISRPDVAMVDYRDKKGPLS